MSGAATALVVIRAEVGTSMRTKIVVVADRLAACANVFVGRMTRGSATFVHMTVVGMTSADSSRLMLAMVSGFAARVEENEHQQGDSSEDQVGNQAPRVTDYSIVV